MRRKLVNSIVLALLLNALPGYCSDSTRIMTRDQLLSIVRSYHPVVKQAAIQMAKANAEVQKARGGFDPALNAALDRKTFNGKLYYSYFKPELNVPTWYGVEFKAGYEEAIGDRLSSEATNGVTSFVGVKIPVTSLLYDKRRAALQQAKLYTQVTAAEQKLTINNLLYDANAAYINWTKEYLVYRAVCSLAEGNKTRMKFLRTEVVQGSRPAIDTTEAQAQYEVILQQQYNSRVNYINAGLELSNYMWLDNNLPAQLDETVVPDTTELDRQFLGNEIPTLAELLTDAATHPKVQALTSKVDILELDMKLKSQYLLPKLSVNANLLSKGYGLKGDVNSTTVTDNNKLGMEFNMPLFLREARGNLRAAKLKITETELEKDQVSLSIDNKVKSYYNDFVSLQQQTDAYTRAYNNYRAVFNGETTRFNNGESTIFMVNTRELKLLETLQKLVDIKAKYRKAYAGMFYAAGTLQ